MSTRTRKGNAVDAYCAELEERIDKITAEISSGSLNPQDLEKAKLILSDMTKELEVAVLRAEQERAQMTARPKPFFGIF